MNGLRYRGARTPGHAAALLLLCIFLIPLQSAVAADPLPGPEQRVLVLHSYHPGYTWTDSLHQAIMEVLLESPSNSDTIVVSVEYMDTQRSFTEDTFDLLEAIFRDRYTRPGSGFDVIIATDDPALDFLQERGERLFGTTPVVFCGINNLDPRRLEGFPRYTGVNETIDIAETIEMALQLRPRTKKIAVVSDTSFTGRLNVEIYRSLRPLFWDTVEFVELLKMEPQELSYRLGRLDPSDAVLVLSYFVTPDGHRLSVERSFSFITESSPAPVYSFWDFALHTGTVGGSLVSAREQGGTAAAMARQVLSGTPVEEIPLVMESPNQYMVDYQAMQKHRIPRQKLPDGTVIVGVPETPWSAYRGWIAGMLLFILLQSILIVALLSSRKRRKRAQRELMAITDNSPDIIMRVDLLGRCTFVSHAITGLLPLPPARLIGTSCLDATTEIGRFSGWRELFDLVLTDRKARSASWETEITPGTTATLESRLVPEFEDTKLVSILVITRDVTEETRTRKQLARSLEAQEVLLREIHHRVKNNLQVVASLINISIMGKHDVRDALQDVQQRVIAMAQIHEQLYQSGKFTRIDLGSYVRNVVSHVVMAYENVNHAPEVVLDLQDVSVNLDAAVPFGLILTELVTNVLKHGYPPDAASPASPAPPAAAARRPLIAIDLVEQDQTVLLRVADNGCGFPMEVSIDTAVSTGLTLVRALVQQIRGSVTVVPRGPRYGNETGATVEIVFPATDQV